VSSFLVHPGQYPAPRLSLHRSTPSPLPTHHFSSRKRPTRKSAPQHPATRTASARTQIQANKLVCSRHKENLQAALFIKRAHRFTRYCESLHQRQKRDKAARHVQPVRRDPSDNSTTTGPCDRTNTGSVEGLQSTRERECARVEQRHKPGHTQRDARPPRQPRSYTTGECVSWVMETSVLRCFRGSGCFKGSWRKRKLQAGEECHAFNRSRKEGKSWN
jgi:hypothetical protein